MVGAGFTLQEWVQRQSSHVIKKIYIYIYIYIYIEREREREVSAPIKFNYVIALANKLQN